MSEQSESTGVVEFEGVEEFEGIEDAEVEEAAEAVAGRRPLRERGLATVEYAVGILLILTVVGSMIWSAQQGWFKELVQTLFGTIFALVTRHLVA